MPAALRADFDPTNSAPPSQSILVIYYDGDAFSNAPVRLAGNLPNTFAGINGPAFNFSVTYLPVANIADGFYTELAAAGLTLEQFDQVWDLRFYNSTSLPGATAFDTLTSGCGTCDQELLAAYMAQGGSIYLQGENIDFHTRNDSLQVFLNTYVNNGPAIPYPSVTNIGTVNIDIPGSTLADNFHTDFTNLQPISTTYPGTIPYNATGSGVPVTRFTAGCGSPAPDYCGQDATMAVAFNHQHINPAYAAGKVFVNWEFNMIQAMGGFDSPNVRWVANIADFLTPQGNINIAKSAQPKTMLAGDTVTFTLVTTNTMATALTNLNVWDTLPSNLSYLDATPAPAEQSGNYIRWNIASLAGLASTTQTIRAVMLPVAGVESVSCNCANGLASNSAPLGVPIQSNCEGVAGFNFTADTWASYLEVETSTILLGSDVHLYPLINNTTLSLDQTNTSGGAIAGVVVSGTFNSSDVIDHTLTAASNRYNFMKASVNYPLLWEYNTSMGTLNHNKSTLVLGGNGTFTSQFFVTHLNTSSDAPANGGLGDNLIAINPGGTNITLDVEFSTDNGATWSEFMEAQLPANGVLTISKGTNNLFTGDYRIFACEAPIILHKGGFLNNLYNQNRGFQFGAGSDGHQVSPNWIYGTIPNNAGGKIVVTAVGGGVTGYEVEIYNGGGPSGNISFSTSSGTWSNVTTQGALAVNTTVVYTLGAAGSRIYRVRRTGGAGELRVGFGGGIVDSGFGRDDGEIFEGDDDQWWSTSFTFGTSGGDEGALGISVPVDTGSDLVTLTPYGAGIGGLVQANNYDPPGNDWAVRYPATTGAAAGTKILNTGGMPVFLSFNAQMSAVKAYSGPPFVVLIVPTPTPTPTVTPCLPLIGNGDMESATGGDFLAGGDSAAYNNWFFIDTGACEETWDTAESNSPTHSLKLNLDDMAGGDSCSSGIFWVQNLGCPDNTCSYTVCAWVKTDGGAGNGFLSIEQYNAAGSKLFNPTVLRGDLVLGINNTNWTQYCVTVGSGAATWGGTMDHIRIVLGGDSSFLQIWFDDVTVVENCGTLTSTPTLTTTPTWTPTWTPTASETHSPTSTWTPTATSTHSPTSTLTSTATLTPTPTATPTNTLTHTPTVTLTATESTTPTPTYTLTFTPTHTLTSTQTSTLTITLTTTPTYTTTNTPTFTLTATESASPTPTFTVTLTATRTITYTHTPTTTPTYTLTHTRTSTSTYTNSPTATYTSTHSPTLTHTPVFTPTPTPTHTPTDSPTPTFTPTPTDSPTLTHTPTHTVTLTATGTYTLTTTRTFTPTQTVTPTDTPTYTLTVTPTITLTSTESASPTPTFTSTWTPTYTLTSTESASPTPTFTYTWTPTYTLTSTESASPTPTFTLTSTPTVTLTHTPTYTLTATPTATRSWTSTYTTTFTATVTATSTHTPYYSPTNTPTLSTTPTISPTFTPIPTLDRGDLVRLEGLYPNPFSDKLKVFYVLARPARVTFTVYNVAGEVIYIENWNLPAGPQLFAWPGINHANNRCASGIYPFHVSGEGTHDGSTGGFWDRAAIVR